MVDKVGAQPGIELSGSPLQSCSRHNVSVTPQIPGVTLAEEIGAGGFGTVYRGVQTLIGRDVAVKVDSRSLTDERDRRRFEREITAAGRVSAHPNIVSLYDAGITAEGRPFLVMELYTGGSYASRMKSTPPIPTGEVLDVGIAIADALAAAHDEGILHRDVKPANILISRYGTPALTDFGLAALPRPGAEASVTLEALTPAYSSPESFARTPPSAATDIFGLGSTLYALLKGGPPRSDQSGQSPSLPHLLFLLNQPLPALDTRPDAGELMKVIQRATETLPANRYATAAQMRDDLMLIKAGYPIIRPQSPHVTTAPSAQTPPHPDPESPTIGSGAPSLSPADELTGRAAGPTPTKSRTRAIAVAAVVILVLVAIVIAAKLTADSPPGTTGAAAGASTPATNTPATQDALGAYLGSATVDGSYNIEVLPPREALFYQGDKGFHCVAALSGAGEVTTGLKGN